jgi:hypothetical protein
MTRASPARATVALAGLGLWAAATLALAAASSPQVILTMSRDAAYWSAAYDNHSDLDADGIVERGYRDALEYAGYFHADLCYAYSATNLRFEPAGAVDDPSAARPAGAGGAAGHSIPYQLTSRGHTVAHAHGGLTRPRAARQTSPIVLNRSVR